MGSLSVGTDSGQPVVLTIGMQAGGQPVVEVTRDGRELVFRERCPWCRAKHRHGAHGVCCESCPCELHEDYSRPGPCTCPVGSGDGSRSAHCTSRRSPYRLTGYALREVRP